MDMGQRILQAVSSKGRIAQMKGIQLLCLVVISLAVSAIAVIDGRASWESHHPPTTVGPVFGSGIVTTLDTETQQDNNPCSDADLQVLFHKINEKYFNGALKSSVTFKPENTSWWGLYRPTSDEIEIAFRRSFGKESCADMIREGYAETMTHEMAHAWVSTVRKAPTEGHGPVWRAKMRNLAREGAFDSKLFTPSELAEKSFGIQ